MPVSSRRSAATTATTATARNRRPLTAAVGGAADVATVQALLDATREFFDRYNRTSEKILSVIGAHPAGFA